MKRVTLLLRSLCLACLLAPEENPSVCLVTNQECLCLFALKKKKQKTWNKKIVLKHFRQSPLSCAQQLLLLSAGVKKHVPFESI